MKQFSVIIKKPVVQNVMLKKLVIRANATLRSIPLRLYAVVKNKLLLNHEVLLSICKLAVVHHTIWLKQNVATALRTIFDKASNAIGVYTDEPADVLLTKAIKGVLNKVRLTSSKAGVVWDKIAGKGSNVMRLVHHLATAELWIVAGKGENKILLKQSDTLSQTATKYEVVKQNMIFSQTVAAKIGKSANLTPDIIKLKSCVEAHLARLRLLGEMDSDISAHFLLSEFDDMTLEDIDFVTV